MKFQNYLQEEYFTRLEDSEIFKNPSQKEILSCWNKGNARAIRALMDFDNNVLFLFESDLLHQVAIKHIVKEYKESGIFYCIEAWERNGKVRVTETGEGFKVVNGKALSLYLGEKEPSRADINSLKNKFKFLGELSEEYFSSFVAREHSRLFQGGQTTIFKNPSKKELGEITKEAHTKSIRYFVDIKNKDLYCWRADTVHYMVQTELQKEKVELDWNNLLKGVAVFKNGKLHLAKENNKYYDWPVEYNYNLLNLNFLDTWFEKGSFKHLKGYIDEEYFTRVKPKYIDKDVDCEIYKNPSIRELITLDREFRNIHSELLKNQKHSNIETLRFIFTEGGPWWASTSMLLHSEIAKKIDRFAGEEIRAMGWIENGNTLYVDAYKQNDWNKIIIDTLTNAGIKYKLEGHNTKTY